MCISQINKYWATRTKRRQRARLSSGRTAHLVCLLLSGLMAGINKYFTVGKPPCFHISRSSQRPVERRLCWPRLQCFSRLHLGLRFHGVLGFCSMLYFQHPYGYGIASWPVCKTYLTLKKIKISALVSLVLKGNHSKVWNRDKSFECECVSVFCKLVAAKQMPLVKLLWRMVPPAQPPVAWSCHGWNKQTIMLMLTRKLRVENPVLLHLLLSSEVRPVTTIAISATQVWFPGCVLCTVENLTAWELHICIGQPPMSGSYQVETSTHHQVRQKSP